MRLDFFPEAREEFFEAALYYESREEGLGFRFRNEVVSAITMIISNPVASRDRGGYRRYNLEVFPYYLAFIVEQDLLLIVAVAHAAREPNYWKRRLAQS